MTGEALIKFYERVADESPLPVIIYNAPGFAGGVQLSPKVVVRLSEHPNIIGMKDSAPTGPNIFLSFCCKFGKFCCPCRLGKLFYYLSSCGCSKEGCFPLLISFLTPAVIFMIFSNRER